jgi:glycosyltransferase involved in cell wall biosynthesis
MKGAAYLLEAFQRIDPARARLTLVGALGVPNKTFARYADRVRRLGPVPHGDIPALLSRADCFIFPSLFEGGGIVLYEAAACGLGVIQTDACGDGVREDNGLTIAAASTEAIVAAVETALEGGTIERWAEASWRIREERTWARYRSAVVNLMRGEALSGAAMPTSRALR